MMFRVCLVSLVVASAVACGSDASGPAGARGATTGPKSPSGTTGQNPGGPSEPTSPTAPNPNPNPTPEPNPSPTPPPPSPGDVAGDGACTGTESAATVPQDCAAVVGDGYCTHSESAASTPVDCRAVLGDGACTHSEHAGNAPVDCPAIAGDAYCTHQENAATTPQDCPAVFGDGYCTHDEDHITAPGECLPPDVDFMGGSLSDLRGHSANLEFSALRIFGDLVLSPLDGAVTLTVQSFANEGGQIRYSQGTCDYRDAPDVTILAEGHVDIASGVRLYGKSGSGTTSSSSCNQCNGRSGGNFRVEADSITVRAMIETWGGIGSRFTTSGVQLGCDGGDGGNVDLIADSWMDYGPQRFSIYGGSGGTQPDGSGTDGTDGVVTWYAPDIDVTELEPNGAQGLAQPIALARNITIDGSASGTDDQPNQSSPTALFINFDPSTGIPPDYVEDVYTFEVTQPGTSVILGTTVTNGQSDIDLYLANATTGQLIGQSNDADGYEQIQTSVPVGTYLILVSWVPGSPATDYALTVNPYRF